MGDSEYELIDGHLLIVKLDGTRQIIDCDGNELFRTHSGWLTETAARDVVRLMGRYHALGVEAGRDQLRSEMRDLLGVPHRSEVFA